MSQTLTDPLNKNNEPYPVHEIVKVLRGVTLFKNAKWWEAVLLVETTFNERTYKKIIWYRWSWGTVKPRDNSASYQKWIRKEHKNINFQKNWNDAKVQIDSMIGELT
jgi:hypothetical protein